MDKESVLTDIRAIAEAYVKGSIPDEYPYFNLVWEHIEHPLTLSASDIVPEEKAAWFERFLSKDLGFAGSERLSILTPTVIFILEAVASELGGQVAMPTPQQIVEAIQQCAKSFGAPKAKAKTMAEGLAGPLSNLLHRQFETSGALVSPSADVKVFPFLIWESDKDGIPLPKRGCNADKVSDMFRTRNKYHLLIYLHKVYARLDGKTSVNVDAINGVMLSLLTMLIRYKMCDILSRELYEIGCRTGDGTPQATRLGYSDKDIVDRHLKSPICKIRDALRGIPLEIKNTRSLGYRCEGNFLSCLVIPSSDEPQTRIVRLE